MMNHIVNSSNITVVQFVSYVEDMSINDLFVSISVIVMERIKVKQTQILMATMLSRAH